MRETLVRYLEVRAYEGGLHGLSPIRD